MKLDVTELGPIKRALKIEVPQETVNQEFGQAYAHLNKQVQIPGFRPGKAPVPLLEKRYGKAVEQDILRRLVPDYYEKAVREAGVVPVQVDIPPLERMKLKRNEPFAFTATVEIKPKIELRDYRPPNPISLKPDPRKVTDDQVNQALGALQEQQAQLEASPDGTPVAEGHYVIVDMEGFLDGDPLEGTKKEGHLHQVGSKAPILGIEIDDQVMGKKEGEVVDIAQPYPENHPDARLAGKTVTFKVTIKSLKQKKVPDLDDEFAKDLSYASLAELTDKVREQLEERLRKEIEESYKEKIIERLVETHHFDLPETLVERELKAMIRHSLQERARHKGGGGDDVGKRQEELARLREEHLPEAKRRVKLGLILEAISDKEGLRVTEEEIAAEIDRLASDLKLSPEEVRRIIDAGGEESREDLRGRLLAEKAIHFVYQHAVIQG